MQLDKRTVIYIASAIAVLIAAYGFGRFSAPTRVETKVEKVETEKVVEKIDDTRLQQLTEELKQMHEQLIDVKKHIHREEHTIKHSDGSEETTKTEDINLASVVKDVDVKLVDRDIKTTEIHYVDRVVTQTQTVEKDKIVERSSPPWIVGVMGGIDLRTGQTIYGGEIDHRIVGPISGGAWGLSSGAFGVKINLEF